MSDVRETRLSESGQVVAVCASLEKGTPKLPCDEVELRAGYGIVGDAHGGSSSRQVSLLPKESIGRIRAVMPEIGDGAFGENIVTSGLDLSRLRIGDRLHLGCEAVIEVTQIGKECHEACAIRRKVGDCIMPREGIFCRVRRGGRVSPGDPVR